MNRAVSSRTPMRSLGVTVVAAGAALVGASMFNLLPFSVNPFRASTVDHSSPVLLKSVADIGEYHAATANLQMVVDIENDTRFVPSMIKGERTEFLATGTVDAGVDFSKLDKDAITVDAAQRRVTVRLPSVTLYPADIDSQHSRIVGRERGLVDRVGSAFTDGTSDHKVYALAERRLGEGAAADLELTARAKANTERMLRGLAGSLGYREVVVSFAAPPAE